MNNVLADSAMTYCVWRITIGAVVSILIASIVAAIGVWMMTSNGMNTSDFLETSATPKSRDVASVGKNKYSIMVYYTFVVDGTTYNATYTEWTQHGSRTAAENAHFPMNETRQVYYSASDPSRNTFTKNSEDYYGSIMLSVASAMVASATFSIMFRNNPLFCGVTIAGDVASAFRN